MQQCASHSNLTEFCTLILSFCNFYVYYNHSSSCYGYCKSQCYDLDSMSIHVMFPCRWYHHAALVMWPKHKHYDLCTEGQGVQVVLDEMRSNLQVLQGMTTPKQQQQQQKQKQENASRGRGTSMKQQQVQPLAVL